MTLLNAPEYDGRRENRKRNLLVGSGILLALLVVTGIGGFLLGHGWFFSNLPAEHRVSEGLLQGLWDLHERCGLAAASAEV
jgi:hypothetical protein